VKPEEFATLKQILAAVRFADPRAERAREA
jgi:hypothetical protein